MTWKLTIPSIMGYFLNQTICRASPDSRDGKMAFTSVVRGKTQVYGKECERREEKNQVPNFTLNPPCEGGLAIYLLPLSKTHVFKVIISILNKTVGLSDFKKQRWSP